jgi:uncharacterized membrane protein
MQLLTNLSANADLIDFGDSGGQVVASYPIYAEAQQAIDRLADAAFPVQYSEIIGRDVRLIERVTGRMTDARAAAAGAVTGAGFGLFIGLLVGLFTFGPAWIGLILGGLLIGSLWGALFGFLAHRTGTGRHDFASLRSLAASRYDVTIADAYAERARQLLSPLS